jgi:hypothetical protein
MKLILCPKCSDVVKCGMKKKRYCKCRKSWGMYVDELFADIGGYAVSVCFGNRSFVEALIKQPETGRGYEFTAWIPSRHCENITNYSKDMREELGEDND